MQKETRKTPKTLKALCLNPWWIAAGDTAYLNEPGGPELLKTVVANTSEVVDNTSRQQNLFTQVDLPRGAKYLDALCSHLKCDMVERCQAVIKGYNVNIWVDEEGKVKGGFQVHTQLKGARYSLAGRLMFVQARGNGETDIRLTPEDIAEYVEAVWFERG